jgi:dihydrofolate synthase/folylpolyglutamate synthase
MLDTTSSRCLPLLPSKAVPAIPVDKLYGYAQKHSLNGTCYQTIAQAFNKAKANAKKDDFIFIGGSSYVVADLLSESF